MIMLLLLAAVGAGAFWAGKNSRSSPPPDIARAPTGQPPARRQVVHGPAPVWPWVVGAAILGVLLLGMAAGPPGLLGPGLFGGPGLFAGLMGP
jgi:hypothetical protein